MGLNICLSGGPPRRDFIAYDNYSMDYVKHQVMLARELCGRGGEKRIRDFEGTGRMSFSSIRGESGAISGW